jgi:aromatic ring-opening dioxygenase catalytic subunit (LigB family)
MPEPTNKLSRRKVIASTLGGAAAVGIGIGVDSGRESDPPSSAPAAEEPRARLSRLPVVFVPHGGGPWPFVDVGFGEPSELDALSAYLRSLPGLTSTRPRALLVVSAHWEEAMPTVMTAAHPPLLYDYYGFPPESYALSWPAPGEPQVAARVRDALGRAGFSSASNAERGFDHGTFVPLKVAYPGADVPVVQLSLKRGLDPAEHLAIGKALAPLRDEGVLIIGSGMSYHNLRGFSGAGRKDSETFDAWLRSAATAEPRKRAERLSNWHSAPAARSAHPREEHLLPLMVVAGAAADSRGHVAYDGTFAGMRLSAFQYG